MDFNFKTIQEFNDYFKDERTCYAFLESLMWEDSVPVCPHCGSSKKPYTVKPRGKFQDIPSYRCSDRDCDLPFTVRTGSIFEGSKVELRKWFQAMYEITTSKKGISSVELSNRIGVSQKTAWLINHKIRTMLIETQPDVLDGMVEADETYIGGKNKNRHASKRVPFSQGGADKFMVVGLAERGGDVLTFVADNTNADTLQTIVTENVHDGATIVTDAHKGYIGLDISYSHITVKHKDGDYVKVKKGTKYHTQNIENFWSQLKRGYVGIYHYMSKKHLVRYCNEFAVRYNHRDVTNIARFIHVVKNSSTKKITYTELTSN